jgi:cytochrome P450
MARLTLQELIRTGIMAFNYDLLLIAADDPYPTYRWMRDEDPAHYSETEDIWVLTRYDDCTAAFGDWQTWSSQRRGNLVNDIPARVGKTLGTIDPPRHTFFRKLVNKAFTPRVIAKLEPTIRSLPNGAAPRPERKGRLSSPPTSRPLTTPSSWALCSGCPKQSLSGCAIGWMTSFSAKSPRRARNRSR